MGKGGKVLVHGYTRDAYKKPAQRVRKHNVKQYTRSAPHRS